MQQPVRVLLTIHTDLNNHIYIMKISDDKLCAVCHRAIVTSCKRYTHSHVVLHQITNLSWSFSVIVVIHCDAFDAQTKPPW